ncbi:hypothetical protein CNYM01_04852 [Colletotrichum nymphaeae SA-01]|uniref:Uncharacterized protein n=1 Tax=Colletotrichum nymphaeae SA-01 TaxID=1460502 RepID=A0A135UXM2_9PEZI|nr:hypothetical protein CNYM01_04852 [Colletotrichum nymphaeae SA-01]
MPALTWRRRPSENECSNANEPLAPMSLNHLKASEIIQRVHGDANNLLRNIQGLLRYSRAPALEGGRLVTGVLLGNPKLLHAQKISQHITGDMAELVAISQKSKDMTLRTRRPSHLRKVRRKQHGQAEHAAAAAGNHHSHAVSYRRLHQMFLISPARRRPFLILITTFVLPTWFTMEARWGLATLNISLTPRNSYRTYPIPPSATTATPPVHHSGVADPRGRAPSAMSAA